MLLCDGRGCSVAVHQQCYGVAKVPKGKWLCDACKDKLSPTAANCACCPVVGGALRKVSLREVATKAWLAACVGQRTVRRPECASCWLVRA